MAGMASSLIGCWTRIALGIFENASQACNRPWLRAATDSDSHLARGFHLHREVVEKIDGWRVIRSCASGQTKTSLQPATQRSHGGAIHIRVFISRTQSIARSTAMQLLLIHQNFPGQFRQLGPAWQAAGHQLIGIGSTPAPNWPGIDYIRYHFDQPDGAQAGEASPLERGAAIARACRHLRDQGVCPDVVIAHCAWGEALQLRHAFPASALIVYPELWLSARAFGVGFDPDLNISAARLQRHLHAAERLNLLADLAISQADAAVVANTGQRNTFPMALQQRIQVISDGVDDAALHPDPQAQLTLPGGTVLKPGDAVVTLVSRQLEPLRGLRQLLKTWPLVAAAQPDARLVLVGGDSDGYGIEPAAGADHLTDLLEALPNDIDRTRIHALGRMPYAQLMALLQCSACHVGLSYPYTVSWSTLEAMSCGAPVVMNTGHTLEPDVVHAENAWIVPFADTNGLAEAIVQLLRQPKRRQAIGAAGRRLIQSRFSLAQAIQGYDHLFQQITGATPPAARAKGPSSRHAGVAAKAGAMGTREL